MPSTDKAREALAKKRSEATGLTLWELRKIKEAKPGISMAQIVEELAAKKAPKAKKTSRPKVIFDLSKNTIKRVPDLTQIEEAFEVAEAELAKMEADMAADIAERAAKAAENAMFTAETNKALESLGLKDHPFDAEI